MSKRLYMDDTGYKTLAAAIVENAIVEYRASTLALKRLGLPESEILGLNEKALLKYHNTRMRCGSDPEALKKAKHTLTRERYNAYKYNRDLQNIKECETFFRSKWFEMLTDLDGEYVINQMKHGAILRSNNRLFTRS